LKLSTLKYEKRGHMALLGLTTGISGTGPALNLAEDLSEVCSHIQSDREIRAVLLYCHEKNALSMSGEALEKWASEVRAKGERLPSMAGAISGLEQPVVAGIRGDAIGPGLELALACDVRIGTSGSSFGLPYINLGLIPWDGGTQRLSRLIGKGKAMEMVLTGQIIDAQEAYRVGLLNRLASDDEVKGLALDMVTEMASKAPFSLAYAKEAVNKGMDLTLEQGLRLEADLYFLIQTTQDRTEGIRAFQEKRKPLFEGK